MKRRKKIPAQDPFVAELRKGYKGLEPRERKRKIRELVAESQSTARFIRKEFPDFYAEAFPKASSRGAGRSWAAGSRSALAAKRR